MDSIYIMYEAINKLEQIKRTGWVMKNVPAERLESVADHTLQVIILATTFVYELNLNFDISRLVQMCFIHDIGESLVGDVSDIDADVIKKKEIEKNETVEFLKSLPRSLSIYLDLWLELEEKKTDMAIFVHQVDKLDAVLKAKKYSIDYNDPELFWWFYNYQVEKGTFNTGYLSEIFKNIKDK